MMQTKVNIWTSIGNSIQVMLESFNKNFTISLTHVYMLHIYKTNIICSTENVNTSPFEPMNGILSHFLW